MAAIGRLKRQVSDKIAWFYLGGVLRKGRTVFGLYDLPRYFRGKEALVVEVATKHFGVGRHGPLADKDGLLGQSLPKPSPYALGALGHANGIMKPHFVWKTQQGAVWDGANEFVEQRLQPTHLRTSERIGHHDDLAAHIDPLAFRYIAADRAGTL